MKGEAGRRKEKGRKKGNSPVHDDSTVRRMLVEGRRDGNHTDELLLYAHYLI